MFCCKKAETETKYLFIRVMNLLPKFWTISLCDLVMGGCTVGLGGGLYLTVL